jgi:two-component SAPR family response regulator
VTINHLRRALGELDGIKLICDRGVFKIIQTEDCYCDYTKCFEIIASDTIEENRDELIEILTRGKFLELADLPLFDSFKETVEKKLEPILIIEMKKNYVLEYYQTVISFSEAICNIDPINDEAIIYQTKALLKLGMENKAKKRYQTFVTEYKKIIGANYHYSFNDLAVK